MQENKPDDNEYNVNRLAGEKSPYLLQHAHNPVDWYPWGEEAFDKAKQDDKPIFLSIGYSTCHWCHVMERESFEDPQVAELMNEAFVSIKVDREERPDIDTIYMSVCQALTGRGGWPLSIIMTPDKKPFMAATYIPRESRYGMAGMLDIVPAVSNMWTRQREELISNAEEIVSAISGGVRDGTEGPGLDESALDRTYQLLRSSFDPSSAGFGNAPKFPTPHHLTFLLRYWKRSKEDKALEMAEETLKAMRKGGIYDHIGFGFHRYSTDSRWLVPHFEKMLYDQALISIALIETYQATQNPEYRENAEEVFSYVLRDMHSPEGGFYSAEDADSEGEEGRFYLWTEQELEDMLGEMDAGMFKEVFHTSPGGNFLDEASRTHTGRNILHLEESLRETAERRGEDYDRFRQSFESSRRKLFEHREMRVHPSKDDKIMTDWNSLMIVALSKAARAFDEPAYAREAALTADFILSKMVSPRGRLFHRYRDGEVAVEGFLDDYAFFIWGLIELYQATFNTEYLRNALLFNDQLILHFRDSMHGGFFHTADDSEKLIMRSKEIYDGAIPSGNSVCALNLLHLGRITGNTDFENKAYEIMQLFSGQVSKMPIGYTQLMCALDFAAGPSREIVVAGDPESEETQGIISDINREFVPNKVILLKHEGRETEISAIAEYVSDMSMKDGRTTVHICQNYNCNLPSTDRKEILRQLKD
ncbi:MAG: thioredoxin domain-containing protein [Methanolobus sp.]|uniref:thioredoxin domain-containing protein n=1 Tax=Methanolobus sp. TaxID=1874737 RepID=UPI002730C705|nr:thioredoxin domain-containing protein [Methanolobus sp.]MDP2217289.1 thioredoxin domain-containing protein [Methanolobus sp.]